MNDPIALAAFNRRRGELVVTNAQMAAVRVPTLGVIGGADGFIVGMKDLKMILPSHQVVVIDGATHAWTRGAANASVRERRPRVHGRSQSHFIKMSRFGAN